MSVSTYGIIYKLYSLKYISHCDRHNTRDLTHIENTDKTIVVIAYHGVKKQLLLCVRGKAHFNTEWENN